MKPLFDDSATEELTQLKELTTNFEALTGISIQMDLEPTQNSDASDYFSVVDPIMKSQSTKYDIIAIDSSWIYQWPEGFYDLLLDQPGSAQTAQDIRNRINEEDDQSVKADATDGGNVVAIPMWADYSVVYGRADLLAKYNITTMPTSYLEMKQACQTVLTGEGPTHRSLQCFVSSLGDADIVELFAEWIYTNNSTPLIKYPNTVSFDTERNRQLLRTYADWVKTGNFISDRALQYDSKSALSTWLLGDALFYRGKASHALKTYKTWANKAPWAPVVISGNNPAAVSPIVSVVGGYHLAMPRFGGNKNDTMVAMALLFLTSAPVQRARALRFGAIPTLTQLTNDPETCTAVNCSRIANLAPYDLPSEAAAPFWVQAVDAMSPYFTGILNGTYDAGTGLGQASAAVQRAFIAAAQKPTESGALSTTAVILLAVLVPMAVVALLLCAGLWWKSQRSTKAAVLARQEEITVGSGASGTRETTRVPSMAERKDHGVVNLSIRPARRPDASNAADIQRVVGTGAAAGSVKNAGPNTPTPSGLTAHDGDATASGYAAAPGTASEYRDRNSTDLPDSQYPHRSPRSRTSSGDYPYISQRFTVIHAYKPAVGDELEIRPGDVVSVRLAYDDGYAFGHNEMTATAGVFPLACLLPVGMEVGLPSRLESGASNFNAMQHASEKVDSLEMLLLSGRITEQTYLSLRREQEEELRTQRQITALRERLAQPNLEDAERRKLQNRLDELELGI
ncbi:hypothetical protein PhCBS80983_g04553 [Powellomyces hirtus]|uniref:SH3 domain-containing protein n=1 Tax=Powellomyces hirtus TaxID=109895 RepID=A0A507DYY4_9FUNG|nr:hypothetical protein PhCBS80983_g04553 [Powellomyces hirtus]